MASSPSSSEKPRVLNPPNHAPFHPSYSHICSTPLQQTSRLITFAGQVGHNSSTNTTPSSFLDQVEAALANLKLCLEAAGAKKTDIVMVKHYVVNLLDQDESKRAEIFGMFMEGHSPPSALLGVQALAARGLLYEVEVMAVVHG